MGTTSGVAADIGSTAGRWRPTREPTGAVEQCLTANRAVVDETVRVTVGDDSCIPPSHRLEGNTDGVRELAWNAFEHGAEMAEQQGLYGGWAEIDDGLGDRSL